MTLYKEFWVFFFSQSTFPLKQSKSTYFVRQIFECIIFTLLNSVARFSCSVSVSVDRS